jgi:hypothetical protein
MTKDGHIYCKGCLYKAVGDDSVFSDKIKPDRYLNEYFECIKIRCRNEQCNWNGPYLDYESHIEFCNFEKNKNPICKYCDIEIPHDGMVAHLQDCSTKCPFVNIGCNKSSLDQGLNAHFNEDLVEHLNLVHKSFNKLQKE